METSSMNSNKAFDGAVVVFDKSPAMEDQGFAEEPFRSRY